MDLILPQADVVRETDKLSPSNLSSGPRSQVTSVSIVLQTISSNSIEHGNTFAESPHHPRLSSTASVESTSPPIASTKTRSGTHRPYPQGEYTPSDSFSPSKIQSMQMCAYDLSVPELPSTGLHNHQFRHHFLLRGFYFGGHTLPSIMWISLQKFGHVFLLCLDRLTSSG